MVARVIVVVAAYSSRCTTMSGVEIDRIPMSALLKAKSLNQTRAPHKGKVRPLVGSRGPVVVSAPPCLPPEKPGGPLYHEMHPTFDPSSYCAIWHVDWSW